MKGWGPHRTDGNRGLGEVRVSQGHPPPAFYVLVLATRSKTSRGLRRLLSRAAGCRGRQCTNRLRSSETRALPFPKGSCLFVDPKIPIAAFPGKL